MTKEEIAEMEAPKYGFYYAIFKSEEDPLAEEEELLKWKIVGGHDTKEAYENMHIGLQKWIMNLHVVS